MPSFSEIFISVKSIKLISDRYKDLDTREFLQNKRGRGIYRTCAVIGHCKPFVEHMLWSRADFNHRRQRSNMKILIDLASIFLGYSSDKNGKSILYRNVAYQRLGLVKSCVFG